MTAKKKSPAKKIAKKTAPARSKKPTKKKAVTAKAKKAPKKIATASRSKTGSAASAKKAPAKKKKAVVKSAQIKKAPKKAPKKTRIVNKPVKAAPKKSKAELIEELKKKARASSISLAALPAKTRSFENQPAMATRGLGALEIDVTFRLGVAELTADLFRAGETIDSKSIGHSGAITFNDVQTKDVISLTGSCTGTGELTTNRNTRPESGSDNPRKYEEQTILDILIVND